MAHGKFNSSGSRFAQVEDSRLRVFDTQTGHLVVQCFEPRHVSSSGVNCLAWSPQVGLWLRVCLFLSFLF